MYNGGYNQQSPPQNGYTSNNGQRPQSPFGHPPQPNYAQIQQQYQQQHYNNSFRRQQQPNGLGAPSGRKLNASRSTGNLMQHVQSNGQSYQPNHMQQQYALYNANMHSMHNLQLQGSPSPNGHASSIPPPPSSSPPSNPMKKSKSRPMAINGKKKKKKRHGPHKKGKLPQNPPTQPHSMPTSNNAFFPSNGYNQGMNTQYTADHYRQMQPQQQQQQQPISNSYTNPAMPDPAAAFRAIQTGSFNGMNGSNSNFQPFIGGGGGSMTHFYPPPQQPTAPQMSSSMPSAPYGLAAPSSDFIHAIQPTYGQQMVYPSFQTNPPPPQPQYNHPLPQQPIGGGTIVPPPPMTVNNRGEMVPVRPPRKKKHRHKGDKKDKKKKDRKHRKKHKDRHKHRSRKDKDIPPPPPDDKDAPPPPPLPPSGGKGPLKPYLGNLRTTSDDDGSSTSPSVDSDDYKEEYGGKPGHNKFESKSNFVRRRKVVSGVPLSVQKKLYGAHKEVQSSHLDLIHSKRTEKTSATVNFLKKCLLKEVLFQGMDDNMINEIIDVMYRVDCPNGASIIKQNEYGDAYFVIEKGAFDIIHQEHKDAPTKIVGAMLAGKAFGEGSLLYSIPRAATLTATTASVVWALDASKFVEIRQKISQSVNNKASKIVRFLQNFDLFQKHHHLDLVAIGQATTERRFEKNARIINQGDNASEFFLIKSGTCIATIKTDDGVEKTVKEYNEGEYFGERGMFKDEVRAASIIATSKTVRCYVIRAVDFKKLLARPLGKEFAEQIKKYDEQAFDVGVKRPFENLIDCKLEEFENVGVLGVGSFGRVSLVKDPKTEIAYSLKKVRKNKVVETGQQEHVRNERAVLASLDSDFCCRLYGTYQDELNIYFCMEPVLGGELFTVLRWNKRFSEKTARFYAACVVLAFEHLHEKNIIYRDLKPENLLIHKNGYCKLVDFGFAKKRNNSCTLCGTPEYLCPEVIQNYPQGFAVDWWALGIFVFEMVVGNAPFQDDPVGMKMYEKILTQDVEFPDDPTLTDRVQHLIAGLLERNAYQRLGAGTNGTQQIIDHPWFHGLDWAKMRKQEEAPPYEPDISSQYDISHYDAYPDENIVEKLDTDPSVYEWCEDF